MKRIVALFLIPVFLLMSAGVVITSFYCKGKGNLPSTSIKKCCKDVDKGGCCKSKIKIVKVDNDYVGHSSSNEFHKLIHLNLPVLKVSYIPVIFVVSYFKTYWGKAPPLHKDQLYILFRSLII